MMSRYDPFREAMSLRRAMDQLFEQSFVNPSMMGGSQSAFAPMNVSETEQGYQVQMSLPGVKPEDIEMTLHNNTLTIRGHYHSTVDQGQDNTQGQQGQQGQQSGQDVNTGAAGTSATAQAQNAQGSQSSQRSQRRNYLMREISSGSFERTVTFARPVEADQVETSYENGILTVTLPVSAASRPRRINVSSGSNQGQIQAPQSAQTSQPSSSQTTQSSTGTPVVGDDPTNTNA